MPDTKAQVRGFLTGQREAAERQRELVAQRGARPAQAEAECLDALSALELLGLWPGPRDAVHEREAKALRARWAKLKRGYRSVSTG